MVVGARMVANRSDQPVSSVSCWLYQRLAIALQQNNIMLVQRLLGSLLFSSVVYCVSCCISSFVHVHVYIFICTLLVTVVLYS